MWVSGGFSSLSDDTLWMELDPDILMLLGQEEMERSTGTLHLAGSSCLKYCGTPSLAAAYGFLSSYSSTTVQANPSQVLASADAAR